MCKKFAEHFKRYNQMYSFGLLLIITLLVAFLFLRIDALETDIDRYVNEPSFDHNLTVEQRQKKFRTDTIKTEVTVSPEAIPGKTAPDGSAPSGVIVPNGAPSMENLPPSQRELPPNQIQP